MTYILGSRCIDGVVLIGDRKITIESGADADYEDKLFQDFTPLIIGSSGVQALFDKFRERIQRYVSTTDDINIDGMIDAIERITNEINSRYASVLQGQTFDVLVGLKVKQSPSVLQYIQPIGIAETIRKYKAIGHGEPYGSIFLKKLWRKDMTMEQAAEVGYFVIRYIEQYELDNTVGGSPQIWLVPDNPEEALDNEDEIRKFAPRQADEKFLNKLEDNWKTRHELLDGLFKTGLKF